jgi:bacillopeptidase F
LNRFHFVSRAIFSVYTLGVIAGKKTIIKCNFNCGSTLLMGERIMRRLNLFIALAALLAVPIAAATAGEIDPGLAQILEEASSSEQVSVLVFLNDRIDLQSISDQLTSQGTTLQNRHETVVNALRQKAIDTQEPILADLQNLEATGEVESYQEFWVANALEVTTTKEQIYLIANRSDVERVYFNYRIESIAPVEIKPADQDIIAVAENGVAAIRAPEVWAMGITGAGTLVSNIDTGVEGQHPALASRWAGVADSRYAGHPEWAWYDPYLGINDFPYDDGGHGTHTMGTICGGAPGLEVGVAPGAHWIAAAAIDRGGGIPRTVSDAILSFQWMLDPDGNPSTDWDVPDVCSNSWGVTTSHGYAPCDPLFWSYIDACEAAGTVVVFAAGNEGTGGLRRPADRATDAYRNFAVAAVDANTVGWPIAYFSSRGPTYCTPNGSAAIKPDIAGPGVSVRSAYPGQTYTYMSGTSMATPHIAGVVALMRQANPNIAVDAIKQIIYETAHDLGTAGEDNTYGWGMIDAYEAVTRVQPDTMPPVANFVGSPTSGYAPLTVQFTDQSTGNPTSWLWDFGDGTPTSSLQNPAHTYANAGTYTVSLNATNANGSDVETRPGYISVTIAPMTNIHVADITVTRQNSGRQWRGRATIAIVDETGAPVSGATVYGYFNAPRMTTKSGLTGAGGTVTILSDKTKTPPADWCFEVTNVVKAGETYDPAQNVVTRSCESGDIFKLEAGILPQEFTVRSYPNPFNPSTMIEASLPTACDWNISIYNIAGQRVGEFSGSSQAGMISVVWDASEMPSGTYLYRVTAGEFAATDRMLLVK